MPAAPVLGRPADVLGAWGSILSVAICGNLLIALSPLYWGGYSEYRQLSDVLIGEIMSAEYFGATIATVAGILYMHRRSMNLRTIAYAALAVYVVGNFITPAVMNDPVALRVMRFICGLSSGTTFLAAATVIPAQKYASRLIPIFYGCPYVTGFILQPVMPYIFANWGFETSFTLIAAAAAAALLTYPFFPRHLGTQDHTSEIDTPNRRSSVALAIIALALLLQYVANSGLWLFFERIGVVSGHDQQTVANLVGLGTGMALIGMALATVLSERLKAVHGIMLGTVLMSLSVFMLYFSGSLPVYGGAISLFNVMITFVTPFYFILLLKVFDAAKAIIVGNIALMVGFSLGPLLIGYTVHDDTFSLAIEATIGLLALSVVLVGLYALGIGPALKPGGHGARSDQ